MPLFLLALAAPGRGQDIALLDQKAIVQQGTYFGTDLEKVNLLNGQLNVIFPLYAAEGRGSQPAGFPMGLVYNSGLWQMQGGVVSHDSRLFAVGWQLHAGSLKRDSTTQYTYTDAGGARHRLYCSGTCNVDVGTYLSQDSTYLKLVMGGSRKLYLRDGFFYFGFTSAYSQDNGVLYPTLLQDTNGNQITLSYSNTRPFSGATVDFTVLNSVQTPRNRSFSIAAPFYSIYRSPGVVTGSGDQVANGAYTTGTDLVSPFSTPESGQPFSGYRLTSLTLGDPYPLTRAATRTYTFQYNTSGELGTGGAGNRGTDGTFSSLQGAAFWYFVGRGSSCPRDCGGRPAPRYRARECSSVYLVFRWRPTRLPGPTVSLFEPVPTRAVRLLPDVESPSPDRDSRAARFAGSGAEEGTRPVCDALERMP